MAKSRGRNNEKPKNGLSPQDQIRAALDGIAELEAGYRGDVQPLVEVVPAPMPQDSSSGPRNEVKDQRLGTGASDTGQFAHFVEAQVAQAKAEMLDKLGDAKTHVMWTVLLLAVSTALAIWAIIASHNDELRSHINSLQQHSERDAEKLSDRIDALERELRGRQSTKGTQELSHSQERAPGK